ncbi:hypothetical protein Pelo_16368 [Pelomyxa schiedti]|nr:hypothetical protein Pelo_16368 [Pelomyxa schiedti]
MEGDSDSSSDYEQEETTSSPSPIKAEPQIMALAPCDSESDEGELPTTRPRKFTAGTIVPRHGNIAYACPLCTNYSRPGWTHFVSRFSAINSLHVHLKTHLQAHTSTHRRRGRRQASLSEKVERLGGYLMAPPVYTEGVVPFCMQGTPHCHPNNLTQHQNGAVREQDIDILYQRMCCPCCCCHREAEHVNTIRKEPKHETQLASNQRDDNTTTKQLTQVLHSVSFPPCNHLRNQD